jgi:putative ABC transport system permease protein
MGMNVSAASRPVILLLLGGEAVRALFRNKLRSALTMIGITIGIAAVVLVVAVGRAGSLRAEEQLQNLGDNLIWVEAGSRTVTGLRTGSRGTTTLTFEDMDAIRREVPLLKAVAPNIDGRVIVAFERSNWTTGYRGVSLSYLDIKRWSVSDGAPFTDQDDERATSVCLLGQTVRRRLFGDRNPIGASVRLAGRPFEVVGVLAAKGQSATGFDQDDTVVIPYKTAQTKIRGRGIPYLDDILCSASSPEAVEPAVAQIVALMRQRHRIAQEVDDDFNIRRPEEVIKAQLQTKRTFSLLLLTIASVSMLVGGIGIMNVMLASVAERTKEIGLRLAVGASQGEVRLQFLLEAIALSVLGGAFGVGASLGGAYALGRTLGWPMPIPPQAIPIALGFSVAIGVFFGFYPAWRAARLDPIVALHTE